MQIPDCRWWLPRGSKWFSSRLPPQSSSHFDQRILNRRRLCLTRVDSGHEGVNLIFATPFSTRRAIMRRAMQIMFGLSLAAVAMRCQAARPADRSDPPGTIIPTATDPDFGDATPALRKLVAAAKPKATGPQHFCIIGYRGNGGDKIAWVHWSERRRLIFWFGGSDPEYRSDSIVDSNRQLDLDKDVVPTDADVGSSTYLISRLWLDRRLRDCAAKGKRYVVTGS